VTALIAVSLLTTILGSSAEVSAQIQSAKALASRGQVVTTTKTIKRHPTFRKKIFPIRRRTGITRPSRPKKIGYHGGPVMTGPTHLYLIWYGSWDGNSATGILTDLAGSLGASPYFAINSSYMQMDFKTVSTDVTYAGEITDAYSRGKRLTDADVRRVVAKALSSGSLPTDENGIYLVLTSADVIESSGFTKTYCGWHSHAQLSKTDIKFAFIGDPTTQGLSVCSAQLTGPNGNPGADAMASVFAHEVVETVTDPDADAWYDSSGNENADKCAWTFGPDTYMVNGSKANISLGTRYYFIQQNWNAGKHQGCSMTPLN
jgi:hypothetical protein